MKSAPFGVVLHHRAERGEVRLHLLGQRHVAVARRAGHVGDLHLGDAVVQAVRVACSRCLDAGEQVGDLRRGVAPRPGPAWPARPAAQACGRHRAAFGVALVLALRVQHAEHRHHGRATLLRRWRPAASRWLRTWSATAGTSCACRPAASASANCRLAASGSSALAGGGTASRGVGGCARMPAGGAGIAEERLRQVAAGCEQQQRSSRLRREQHELPCSRAR